MPLDHPNYIFGFGRGGDVVKQEADVILVAGSRLGNLDLPYDKYWGDPARQQLIQIDVDPRNMGVTRPLALGIVADVKNALEGLVRVLRAKQVRAARRRRPRRAIARRRRHGGTSSSRRSQSWTGPGIHPAHVMQAVGAVFGRDAVYVTDGGNTSLWAHSCLPPTRPRSYHSILELGMLGTGIPVRHRRQARRAGARGRVRDRRRRRRLQLHGDAVGGARRREDHDDRLRRRLVDDGGAERADALRPHVRHASRARCAGTASPRGSAATASTSSGSKTSSRRCAAPRRRRARPSCACAPTATPTSAIPQELILRFVEVYQGPMG